MQFQCVFLPVFQTWEKCGSVSGVLDKNLDSCDGKRNKNFFVPVYVFCVCQCVLGTLDNLRPQVKVYAKYITWV